MLSLQWKALKALKLSCKWPRSHFCGNATWTFHFYLRLQWDKKLLGLLIVLTSHSFCTYYCTLSKMAELFINTSSPPNLSWTWSRSLWMLSLDVISSWWNWIFVEPSSLLSSAQTSEPAFSSLAAIKECTTIWHWSWF